jgi:hypothetical protein
MSFREKVLGVFLILSVTVFLLVAGYAVGSQVQKESSIKKDCQITTLVTLEGKEIYYCPATKPKA